jgi:predicted metal-dependent HD superfamily phosphohydrolase
MLKTIFLTLCSNYNSNASLANLLWQEIEKHYGYKKRAYHNLKHLEEVYVSLEHFKKMVIDWDTLLFSLFYHDVIYKTHLANNEEKSANFAVSRLTKLGVSSDKIEKCVSQILATKTHELSDNNDTNLFTDADLAVLGRPWSEYEVYLMQIRKEYAIYPNLIYKPGRKKVLKHFIEMQYIYKTSAYRQLHEHQAKENLEREYLLLS